MVTSVVTERGHRALKTSPSRRHLAVSQVTIYTALVTVATSASKNVHPKVRNHGEGPY